jgi:hypothetical protein
VPQIDSNAWMCALPLHSINAVLLLEGWEEAQREFALSMHCQPHVLVPALRAPNCYCFHSTPHDKALLFLYSFCCRFSVAVRAMMSCSIFLTYFIQAYVPFTLIESWVLEYTAEGHEALKSCGVRALVVTITGKYIF